MGHQIPLMSDVPLSRIGIPIKPVQCSILGNSVSKSDTPRPPCLSDPRPGSTGFYLDSFAGRLEWHENCPKLNMLQKAASGGECAKTAWNCSVPKGVEVVPFGTLRGAYSCLTKGS